jgi:hypothetical protein
MPDFYVTIGIKYRDGHPLMPELTPQGYLVVEAEDEMAARRRVFDRIGRAWAFIYDTPPDPAHHPAGEQARLPLRIKDGRAPMFGASPVMGTGDMVEKVAFYEPTTGHDSGVEVSVGWSTVDEGVRVVMIDTVQHAGRIRVVLNDGTLYDGNPEHTPDDLM